MPLLVHKAAPLSASTACAKIEQFFRNTKIPVHIIPVVLVKRKDIEKKFSTLEDVIFINETIEIDKWNKAQSFIEDQRMGYITPKPKLIEDFEKRQKSIENAVTLVNALGGSTTRGILHLH